jgi:hypothetical protein
LMLKEADIQNKAKIVEKQMARQWIQNFKSTMKSDFPWCPLKGG